MANRKNNLRAQATRKNIKKILLKKLARKSIKEITVQEICRDAGINRTAFYLHYDNIYDLIRDIRAEMQQGIDKLFKDADRGTYKPLTEDRLAQLLAYIRDHAYFYRILLNDLNSLEIIDADLATTWKQDVEPLLKRKTDAGDAELLYRYEYFNSGLRGIVRKWLNSNCPEPPEVLSRIMLSFVQL